MDLARRIALRDADDGARHDPQPQRESIIDSLTRKDSDDANTPELPDDFKRRTADLLAESKPDVEGTLEVFDEHRYWKDRVQALALQGRIAADSQDTFGRTLAFLFAHTARKEGSYLTREQLAKAHYAAEPQRSYDDFVSYFDSWLKASSFLTTSDAAGRIDRVYDIAFRDPPLSKKTLDIFLEGFGQR